MAYDYDRRREAAKPSKQTVFGPAEYRDTLEYLNKSLGHISMWAGRAKMALNEKPEWPTQFKSSPREHEMLVKMEYELKSLIAELKAVKV